MPARRLHTGRSRNDQVALGHETYTPDMRDRRKWMHLLSSASCNALLKVMEENTETFMPGFTHLQKAQPITLAHHYGCLFRNVQA